MAAAEPIPHPRRSGHLDEDGNDKAEGGCLVKPRARGIRDSTPRGRDGIAAIADIAVIARDRKSKTLLPQRLQGLKPRCDQALTADINVCSTP